MMNVIRAALVIALGLGMNVLSGGAWADDPAAAAGSGARPAPPDTRGDAALESIWSTP
jgi:hypothetical protein